MYGNTIRRLSLKKDVVPEKGGKKIGVQGYKLSVSQWEDKKTETYKSML